MSRPAPEPSAQEIHRKLSVHSVAKPRKVPVVTPTHVSGTESDSDSALSPDLSSPNAQSIGSTVLLAGSSSQPPLTSIAEARSGGGEESEDDDDDEADGWKSGDQSQPRSADEGVIKSGYLWKKGERRKTWKKRWFVLRPAQLAYYKTSAEYQLLHLLELADIHSCTPVALKKHNNTFGLVSAVRTFYLQASTAGEVQQWVHAIQQAREGLMTASTQNSITSPAIPIPSTHTSPRPPPMTPSPPSHVPHAQNISSSDSEDASPRALRTYSASSQTRPGGIITSSPSRPQGLPKDVAKIVLSGYLMKCDSKRRNWRKRWFVLNGEKLVYSGSHMDTKPHRQFSFSEILDALEFDMKANKQVPPAISSPLPFPEASSSSHDPHTFKIVTTKRTLLLCAPSEEEEIKWLSAVRALIVRRTGAGVVPGESIGSTSKTMPLIGDSGQGGSLGSASNGKHKVRKLSVSSPAAPISEESQERR